MFCYVEHMRMAAVSLVAPSNAVRGQQPPALSLGTASVDLPPRLDQDLQQAAQAGVKLVLMRDDAEVRGIPSQALMPEVEQISRAQLADFLSSFDLVWHW